MKSPAKLREDLAQVQILLQHGELSLDAKTKLILAKARLKWQLLAADMRSQLGGSEPGES